MVQHTKTAPAMKKANRFDFPKKVGKTAPNHKHLETKYLKKTQLYHANCLVTYASLPTEGRMITAVLIDFRGCSHGWQPADVGLPPLLQLQQRSSQPPKQLKINNQTSYDHGEQG